MVESTLQSLLLIVPWASSSALAPGAREEAIHGAEYYSHFHSTISQYSPQVFGMEQRGEDGSTEYGIQRTGKRRRMRYRILRGIMYSVRRTMYMMQANDGRLLNLALTGLNIGG